MTQHFTPTATHTATLILERGEELMDVLVKYATDHAPASAWLHVGVGGAGSATLSFYNLATKTYIDKTFDEPLEILSLQGDLAWTDGKPIWHIHGVFGRSDYSTVGGHVKELPIALTGELHLTLTDTPLTRRPNAATGLNLLAKQ